MGLGVLFKAGSGCISGYIFRVGNNVGSVGMMLEGECDIVG